MNLRIPLIVANWKMNHNVEETLKFITLFQKRWISTRDIEVVICPPFTSLYNLSVALSESESIGLGAQNCFYEEAGAYTGETSPLALKELNCRYVIIGHSERRKIFGETNEILSKKIDLVQKSEMTPIYCVGETKEERTRHITEEIVQNQLTEGLRLCRPEGYSNLVIAYEPVWAIGTGEHATPEVAEEVQKSIRQWLASKSGSEAADKARILYGGSVKPENMRSLMKQPNMDGVLVGGSSLDVDSFLQIVNYKTR